MKMFFSYLIYAHIRLQSLFGWYERECKRHNEIGAARARGFALGMFLGFIQASWFLILIETFTIITGSAVLIKPPIFLAILFTAAMILPRISSTKALNYPYYEKMFSEWPASKRKAWDIIAAITLPISFVLAFYLAGMCTKIYKAQVH